MLARQEADDACQVNPHDIAAFVSVFELLGGPRCRERYVAGQYERKCYRVLVEGWIAWKARGCKVRASSTR